MAELVMDRRSVYEALAASLGRIPMAEVGASVPSASVAADPIAGATALNSKEPTPDKPASPSIRMFHPSFEMALASGWRL